jgi:signal transduction histidine kinase/ligand-binding sensor domain-containing protein/DNA-binding response OmpR family regulator
MRQIILILIYIVIIIFRISGQTIYESVSVNTLNGLSQNDVSTILQDSKGYMWIGTNDGLNKYDGYSFTHFDVSNTNNTFSASIIAALVEDHNQNIWIGTGKEGLCFLQSKNEAFQTILDGKFTGGISHLSVDANNKLWIVSDIGLLRINLNDQPKRNQFELIYSNRTSKNNNAKKVVHLEDVSYFITSTELYYVTPNSYKPTTLSIPILSTATIIDIAVCQNKVIVIDSNGDVFWGNNRTAFTKLLKFKASKILLTKDNRLFFANSTGIYESTIIKNQITLPKLQYELNNINVTSLICDNLNNIWFGATRYGISIIFPKTKKFRHYKTNKGKGSLTSNKVEQIVEDENQNLWIATRNGGVDLLPQKNRNNENGYVNFPYYMNENIALTITKNNKQSEVLFCGYNGVNRIKDLKVSRKVFSLDNSVSHIMSLLDDGKFIWLGYFGNGLVRISDIKSRIYSKFTNIKNDSNSISSDVVRSLFKDKKGNLWIGTTNGISILTPAEQTKNNPKFVRIVKTNQINSLSHNYILPIYEGSDASMWIGTFGGGLNRLVVDKSFRIVKNTYYSTTNGLSNNIIKGILEDENKNIWISTNRGLNKIITRTNEIRNYDVSDGLQDFEFSELSCCKRSDGELLFGGVNGFNAFYPNEIKDNLIEPKLQITKFELLNKEVKPLEKINNRIILEQSISDTKSIELNYNQNSFSFEYAVLQYIAVQKIKYEYQLVGFDKQPILTTATNRIAKYTNLAPGNYKFILRATNNDGVWIKHPIVLQITILTPIWARWYAYLLYMIILGGIIWYLRNSFLKSQKQKFEILKASHEREEAKKNDALKTKFFMDVSHEFRTPLTLIMVPLQKIFEENKKKLDKGILTNLMIIQSNANSLYRLINQLMDFSKNEEEKLILNPQENDICSVAKEIFYQFKPWGDTKNISLHLNLPEKPLMLSFDKGYMEQILFNLISNAVKYCRPNANITLEVKTDETSVIISVADEGYGIPEAMTTRIFERYFSSSEANSENKGTGIGLSLTKSLVELHGGKIWFETQEGVGSTFYIQFELNSVSSEQKIQQVLENKSTESKIIITENETETEKKRLLIVDDNTEIIDLLESIFLDNYDITTAFDGEEGWQKCVMNIPDIVLSDVMMPKMDGMTLCKRIKTDERTSHIPVVLLTARGTTDDYVEGMSAHADAYCAKPFDISALKATISSILHNRSILQRKFKNNTSITPSEIVTTSMDEKFLTKLLKIIDKNMSNADFTIEALASEMGYDQEILNRKLKSLTGQTARPFLRIVRLKRAAELLKLNRYSVSDVTYEVGFTDLKYFRDCFKKEFGMTPSDYVNS